MNLCLGLACHQRGLRGLHESPGQVLEDPGQLPGEPRVRMRFPLSVWFSLRTLMIDYSRCQEKTGRTRCQDGSEGGMPADRCVCGF